MNGVADKLRAVSEELDRLPPEINKYAFPSAGTFNCRTVKDTGNRSAHAWGVAIDINTKFADYWLWAKNGATETASRSTSWKSSNDTVSFGAENGDTSTRCTSSTGRSCCKLR